MAEEEIIISIVIPVKNGMATLPALIDGVIRQSFFNQTEVVIIDSASTDGSIEFLSQFDFVTVVSIDPKTFNHGNTRNRAIEHTKGEFIVMTVQDALPANDRWLETLLKHFEDKAVMGVCGQQGVPHHKDKNPHQWFRPQSNSQPKKVHFKTAQEFLKLSPKEQRECCGWDNVNAMYRKQALLDLPFKSLVFGEDMMWAKMALENGYSLIFDSSARIFHYHFEYPEYTYRRTLISKFFILKCFNYLDTRTYNYKSYMLVIYRNLKWRCGSKWIWHNFKIIRNHRKATKTLIQAFKNNRIDALESELALNIPIGQQNTLKNG